MIRIMPALDQSLWTAGRAQSLAPGETLFRAGDRVRLLYRVESGTMRLVRSLPHGSDLTIQRAGAGAILAEASLFASTYHCDAVALAATCVRGVPVRGLLQALEGDPALARAFAQHLAHEVQAARARAEIVALKTTRERLDAWLALNGGGLPAKGRWRELAEEIAVTPEALYRELAGRRERAPSRAV